MKKVGILTGGADCPGLNSVIRAIVRKSIDEGYVVTGVKNGWDGLVDNDTLPVLDLLPLLLIEGQFFRPCAILFELFCEL